MQQKWTLQNYKSIILMKLVYRYIILKKSSST